MRRYTAAGFVGEVPGNQGALKALWRSGFSHAGRTASLSLVLILSLSGLSACIKKDVLPPSASQIQVLFSLAPPAAIQTGAQTSLMVTVENDAQDEGVDWVASCSAASCGSFNPTHTASGVSTVYTAPTSLPAGNSVNLSARATASPSESVTVTVNIISSISVTLTGFPASPLAAGSSTQVTAKVTGDPNNLGVNWTLLCGAGNCGTITLQTASNAPATYVAPPVTTSLNVTITAISVADPTQTVTANVSVTPTASISIAFAVGTGAPPANMNTSASTSIVAIVSSDSMNLGVDWIVSCTNSSNTCGTFTPSSPAHTASGTAILYTAPATVPTGGLIVSITASSTASPSAFVTALITVNAPVISIGPINGPSSMPVNSKQPVSATVANDPANGGGVDWAVTCTPDPSSTCGTFTSGLPTDHTASGVSTTYTAPTVIPLGSPAGIVTITAKSTANPSSQSTLAITITPSTALSIKFASGADAPPVNVITNATANIAAVVTNDSLTPPNGVNWSVTCGSAGACGSFSVFNTASNAPVVYTAPANIPAGGTVTITGTAAAAPNPSVSATVNITNPVIAVTITQAVSPLDAGSSETIIASVVGDSTAEGVSWTSSCTNSSGGGCGSFSPTSTPGNTPQTSYTAPATVPTGGVVVTLTATSNANAGATGTAQLTIQPNPNLGLLSGPYALSLAGQNASGFYAIVGSVTADGAGNITTGAEDINGLTNDCDPSANFSPVTGTYSIGSDGRGTMTLQTGNAGCFGDSGVQTLSFVVVGAPGTSTVRALVTEFDNATASGSLDLQTLSATISGNYAFALTGVDIFNLVSNSSAAVRGGVFVAGSGLVTSGFQDENDQGSGVVSKKVALATGGTYTVPNTATGRGTITFGPTGAQYMYVYYIVNSGEIKLLSDDVNDDLAVAGFAYTQGAATLSGQNAFTVSGTDGTLDTSLVAGGTLIISGSNLAGGSEIDVNDGAPQVANNTLTGTIVALSNGRGTIALTLMNPPATLSGFSSFAYYPTANNGVLLLELDANFASIGTAYSQTIGDLSTSFAGTYALNFTGAVAGSAEEDVDGVATSDGVSLLTTGTVDVNGAPSPAQSDLGGILLTGGFTTNTSNGRFPGSINLDLSGTDTQKFTEIFYVLNANTVLFIENDVNGQTSGIMQSQNLTLP
jgi:hypothetical protein